MVLYNFPVLVIGAQQHLQRSTKKKRKYLQAMFRSLTSWPTLLQLAAWGDALEVIGKLSEMFQSNTLQLCKIPTMIEKTCNFIKTTLRRQQYLQQHYKQQSQTLLGIPLHGTIDTTELDKVLFLFMSFCNVYLVGCIVYDNLN